jgi:hypothetical protein
VSHRCCVQLVRVCSHGLYLLLGKAGARVDVGAVARDGGVRGLAPIDVGDFWGLVLLRAQFVVCVEFKEAWGGKVAGFGGGHRGFGGFIWVVATHRVVVGWGLGNEEGIQLVWSSIAHWRPCGSNF